MQDQFDVSMTGADAAAIAHYDAGLDRLLTFTGDPVAAAAAAIEAAPGFVMAHALYATLHVLGTERAALAGAWAGLAGARAVAAGATPREQRHLAALEAWLEGRLHDAAGHWEAALLEDPRDALALVAAHQTDFFLGQSTELRDRPARRLRRVDRGSRLEGHYLGMHSFGLEECGDYAAAEAAGRRAVDRCPRDAWAVHAIAHVLEMGNRVDEGIEWLESRAADWSVDNFFAIHNWWHLALYHCDRQDWPAVLTLFDERISRMSSALDMVDASALLWRLALYDVPLGDRWQAVAAAWEPLLDDRWYVFNDVHAMMAFLGAGRRDLVAKLFDVMSATAAASGFNAQVMRDVGLPMARALAALVDGDPATCADGLLPLRSLAARAGGSHAQRDLLSQTLLVAAERAGRAALAQALTDERLALRPGSGLNRRWAARLST